MTELTKEEKQLIDYLMERDGLNSDWYFDCADTLAEASDTLDKYIGEVGKIRAILEP